MSLQLTVLIKVQCSVQTQAVWLQGLEVQPLFHFLESLKSHSLENCRQVFENRNIHGLFTSSQYILIALMLGAKCQRIALRTRCFLSVFLFLFLNFFFLSRMMLELLSLFFPVWNFEFSYPSCSSWYPIFWAIQWTLQYFHFSTHLRIGEWMYAKWPILLLF